jgi:hypothetical protein
MTLHTPSAGTPDRDRKHPGTAARLSAGLRAAAFAVLGSVAG